MPLLYLLHCFMPNAILLATLDQLMQHWQSRSLLPTTRPVNDVEVMARQQGVTLPADFLALYQRSNGMAFTYPNGVESEEFYFLPVEDLRSKQEDLLVYSGRGAKQITTTVTVFVDYMHRSWEYGFITAESGPGYEIGIMAIGGEFKVITNSLATFLSLYLEDAMVLYDYRNPYISDL
ncbi:SMI1/KNR4 family protein [Hymenobacter aerophilus]|uniref:SMI1/KNR4 family protein n=1 Tax=Hymenobacter aerophilus TaxID=119644 RepID=UPI00036D1E50|nr:SMI1/KNR4 family protein [Hymenobacter aerophilus]